MSLKITPKPKVQKKTLESVRILVADIERLPGHAKVQHRGLTVEGSFWDLNSFKHTTGRRIHPDDVFSYPRTICAAGQFYGDKETMFAAEWEKGGNEKFLRTVWEWINQADILVGHNVERFDLKMLRSGWLEYGWAPPSPVKIVDTLKVARSELGMESNTLDALCQRLGLNAKTDKYDARIAQAAVDGDVKAQKKLKSYNIGDIAASTSLYDRLRPYTKSHPHLAMWTGKEWACPNCGYDSIANNPTGEAYANVTRYKSFQCEKCGSHIRGNKKLIDPTATRTYR
ncbi:DnaQ-like exonuclease [Brevibacterium phage Rousseau]|nr:DnaQ-like exonuclease [Brevibacterium phage Rousseau]